MASYDKDAAAEAISSIESGGDYGTLGPATSNGDRAYGKYQVMGANIPEWSKAATGTAMTPAQFLQDEDAQDTIFHHRFGSYVDKYGTPEDAASAWFTGGPRSAATGARKDVLGTTGDGYVSKFSKAYYGNSPNSKASNAMAKATTDDEESTPALANLQSTGVLSPNAKESTMAQIGQTLMNMAPGLASISDPDRAKALSAVAVAAQKQAVDQGTWSTTYDQRTGLATQVNNKNPNLRRQFKYAEPKEDKDPVQQAADIAKVKQGADLASEISTNGQASRAALDSMSPIQTALQNPNVPQGMGGELLHQKNKALMAIPGMGNDELAKTVADTETAKSGINKMVQEGRTLNGGMPGSLSDKDLVFLKESQPGLQNTPQGNQRILDIYKQLHDRRIEKDQAAQAYIADTAAHPLGLDNSFNKQMSDKWTAENAARDKMLAEREAAGKSTPGVPKKDRPPIGSFFQ